MHEETIFSKIIKHKIFTKIIYQDNLITAFYDKNPKAPVHILLVTNEVIPTVNNVNKDHEVMLGRLFTVSAKLAIKEGISKDGYRLIVNCNKHGGQEIDHLHMHLLGGKYLGSII